MNATIDKPAVSNTTKWIGYIVSAIPVAMLTFSGVVKLIRPAGIEEGFEHVGWKMHHAIPLGVVELLCVVIYVIPQTAVLGAILIAAYMGGAVATHLRIDEPVYAQVGIGVLAWLGLWLRESRLRPLLPLRR